MLLGCALFLTISFGACSGAPCGGASRICIGRAEVSQQAIDRYCSALAAVDDSTTLEQLTAAIERRVCWNGKSALHPFDPHDHALLRAVNRGEYATHGLRNRDLQARLY